MCMYIYIYMDKEREREREQTRTGSEGFAMPALLKALLKVRINVKALHFPEVGSTFMLMSWHSQPSDEFESRK